MDKAGNKRGFPLADPSKCRCKNNAGADNVLAGIPASYNVNLAECLRMCEGAEQVSRECQIWFDCHIDKTNLSYHSYNCASPYVSPNTLLIQKDIPTTGDLTVHLNQQNHIQQICIKGSTISYHYWVKSQAATIRQSIQVCGHETIVKVGGDASFRVLPVLGNTYELTQGTNNNHFDDGAWFTYLDAAHVADSEKHNCKMLTYQLFQDAACSVTPTNDNVSVETLGSQTKMYVNTHAWVGSQTWCVMVKTRGRVGATRLVTIDVICGSETIAVNPNIGTDYDAVRQTKYIVYDREVIPTLITEDLNSSRWNMKQAFITTSNVLCPVTQYKLFDRTMPGDTYTVEQTNTHIKLVDGSNSLTSKMTVDVGVAQRYYGAIRGYSKGYDYKQQQIAGSLSPPLAHGIGIANFGSQLTADMKIDIVVCGKELLAHGDGSAKVEYIWQLDEAPGFIDISKWFTYQIPDDSVAECVSYPGLWENIYAVDCTTRHVISGGTTLPFKIEPMSPGPLDTPIGTTPEVGLTGYARSRMIINNSIPQSFIQACVKIITRGKVSITRKFDFEICGNERISLRSLIRTISGVWKKGDYGPDQPSTSNQVFFKPELYKNMFTVDSIHCPIVQWHLYTKTANTDSNGDALYVPFVNPSTSPNGAIMQGVKGADGLMVNTEFSFDYDYKDLYIRAATENARFPAYLAVNVKVCGSETITAKNKEPEIMTIAQKEPYIEFGPSKLMGFFTTNDTACGVHYISLLQELSQEPYIYINNYTGSLIIDMRDFRQTKNMTFQLKAFTVGGKSALKDVLLYVDNRNDGPQFLQGLDFLRILIRITKDELRDGFDEPYFEYGSPYATDREGDTISMWFSSLKDLRRVACADCIQLKVDESQSYFTLRAYKPDLKYSDQGRYQTAVILTDDSIFSKQSEVKIYIDIVIDQYAFLDQQIMERSGNCTAKIISISEYGDTLIRFSQNMRPITNLTHANQTALELYVVPSQDRDKHQENFDKNKLNFTWYAKSFQGDELRLKLDFHDPLEISPKPKQDKLAVHFKTEIYMGNQTCSVKGQRLGSFITPSQCLQAAQRRNATECGFFMHASATSKIQPTQECFCCQDQDGEHLWKDGSYDENWNVYNTWFEPQFYCLVPGSAGNDGKRQLQGAAEEIEVETPLHQDSWTIYHRIRKQMNDNDFSRGFQAFAGTMTITAKAIMVITMINSYFFTAAMSFLVTFINSLQIIIHLPLMQSVLPANVMAFYKILIPIATFDFVEADQLELITTFDHEAQELHSDEILDQAKDLGYENHNAIGNTPTIGLFMLFFHIKVIAMICVCKPLSATKPEFAKWYEKYLGQLIFTELIILLIEGYFEFLISGYYNWRLPLTTTSGEVWGAASGFWCLFLSLIFVPFALIWMLNQSITYINDSSFRKSWRGLSFGINTRRKYTLFYYMAFIIRRILFVSTAFNVDQFECQQIQSIMLMNIVAFMYQTDSYPSDRKLNNQIAVFNEITITVVTMHMLCYTDWISDKDLQYNIGWSHIYWMCLNVLCNLLIAVFFLAHDCILCCGKYCSMIKEWVLLQLEALNKYKCWKLIKERLIFCHGKCCKRKPPRPLPEPPAEESSEEEGPSFLEKIFSCFIKKKPVIDHLKVQSIDTFKKPRKKKVKKKKKKMKLVFVPEEDPQPAVDLLADPSQARTDLLSNRNGGSALTPLDIAQRNNKSIDTPRFVDGNLRGQYTDHGQIRPTDGSRPADFSLSFRDGPDGGRDPPDADVLSRQKWSVNDSMVQLQGPGDTPYDGPEYQYFMEGQINAETALRQRGQQIHQDSQQSSESQDIGEELGSSPLGFMNPRNRNITPDFDGRPDNKPSEPRKYFANANQYQQTNRGATSTTLTESRPSAVVGHGPAESSLDALLRTDIKHKRI